ncbi:hypothetical protein PV755_46445 [Streptomyces caniscabiei]|uniref:hypothetical protein n=1 Tax=Streptomyces caniscabiei TaxID=2746961 RepID=UPI0029AF1714|nr:hypothetical protein [Streptomyces caniscabiei]MDX3516245.1 hypothetical protein [Streptomyces caniscabiei]MDX3725256.1 hypothetical protein [Streptomyces caniscabiei]
MATPVMPDSTAEWIRLNALPPLWHHPDGIDELRTCPCQAPPSEWLGGIGEPAARLWNRNGRTVAWGQAGEDTRFLGARHLVVFWHTARVCCRAAVPTAASSVV